MADPNEERPALASGQLRLPERAGSEPGADADHPVPPVCDFCDAPSPSHAYPVAGITVGAGADSVAIPAAWWNACLDCHQLVETRDWAALAVHAGYPPGFAPTPVTMFRRHRRGVAVPLEAGTGLG